MYGFTNVSPRTSVPLSNKLTSADGRTVIISLAASIHSLRKAEKAARTNVSPRINQLTLCGSGFHPARFHNEYNATMLPPVKKSLHSRHSAVMKDQKSRSIAAYYHLSGNTNTLLGHHPAWAVIVIHRAI
jgi:hypothetical protein